MVHFEKIDNKSHNIFWSIHVVMLKCKILKQ